MLCYQSPAVRVFTSADLADAPESALDAACQSLAERFEPSEATDYAVGYFNEKFVGHGVSLSGSPRNGPTWAVGCQGEGASITIEFDDFGKFLDSWDCDRNDKRRLLWLLDTGAISPRITGKGGRYEGTTADVEEGYWEQGHPGEELLRAAIAWLSSTLERAASEYEGAFLAIVRSDWEYYGSRENLISELDCNQRGITSEGEFVDLAECCDEEEAAQ